MFPLKNLARKRLSNVYLVSNGSSRINCSKLPPKTILLLQEIALRDIVFGQPFPGHNLLWQTFDPKVCYKVIMEASIVGRNPCLIANRYQRNSTLQITMSCGTSWYSVHFAQKNFIKGRSPHPWRLNLCYVYLCYVPYTKLNRIWIANSISSTVNI